MISWYELAEDVLIFKVAASVGHADKIKSMIPEVMDVVVTDQELAVQHESADSSALANQILPIFDQMIPKRIGKEFIVPVCYDLGMDWKEVENQLGLSRAEIERIHQSVSYEVSFGFSPGFIYLSGLPKELHCKRRTIPRPQVTKGSVGIGGEKTGVYSLATPGGWQLIGRTPLELFDVSKESPMIFPDGARVRFVPMTIEDFSAYGNS